MKKAVLFAMCCALVVAAFAQDKTQTSVNFAGEKYFLAYSVKDSAGTWLNEYLRANDNNLNKYKKLIGVRYYEGSKYTPLEIAQITVNNLKKNYPQIGYELGKNDKKGEITLNFLISQGEITELNAFNIGTYNGHTISLQFVRRWNSKKEFEESYEETQRDLEKWINALNSMPMPAPLKIIKK